MPPQAIKGRAELVHDEETVYSQFYDRKVIQLCCNDVQNKTMLCAYKALASFRNHSGKADDN